MKKLLIIVILICLFFPVVKSQTVSGKVFGLDGSNNKTALPGVNIYWAHNLEGTTSDIQGRFEIKFRSDTEHPGELIQSDGHDENSHDSHSAHMLVFSFVGYEKDTIHVHENMKNIKVVLKTSKELEGIEVSARTAGAHISRIEPILTQHISSSELTKAACCNLSESFETNASVDVHYSDALTGAKQIQLLGLAGVYTQLMTENIPNYYGLANSFGLMYVPGTWMESIQVSKGAAAVVNGYESVTGQINVEYKKPDNSEVLYLNVFGDSYGRIEGNFNAATRLSEKWSTMIYGHTSGNSQKDDHNGDSFLDHPLYRQYNFFNRWRYVGEKFMTQFGFQYINEDRTGGQMDFNKNDERIITKPWGLNIKTDRAQVFWKSGFVFNRPATSVGFINSYTYHKQNSFFGLRDYNALQNSYYGNLIFNSYIGNTKHAYSTGASYRYDNYDESLNDSTFNMMESVPGVFFQYTYTDPEKITFIAGIRADFHNIYGTFYTPRFHVKYNLSQKTIARASVGKGYRTAKVLAENATLLASSRQIVSTEKLQQEEAWNYGINLTHYFDIRGKDLTLSADFYRTDFQNQVVVDVDSDVSQIKIYNLNGLSYSNSFQVEASYELIERLDVVAAFRINDVKVTMNDELLQKPLVNKYKGLLTLSYATNLNKWQFDFTSQINGDGRLPNTSMNPVEYQRPEAYPAYTILNAQITKFFKTWSIYVGGENLMNYTQENPIVAPDDPFGPYFDASMVYGPVMGIKIYAGLRFALEGE
ncbi:MAG: TonB-dependent receptor [Bacteroidales bacterium]|nr:TonB-dependent receptor [Bacteroidales bacterium]